MCWSLGDPPHKLCAPINEAAAKLPEPTPPTEELPLGYVPKVPLNETRTLPLVFIHIPRNGGTAIEDMAFRNGILWGRHRPDWPPQPHPLQCFPWLIPRAVWMATDRGGDPYDRWLAVEDRILSHAHVDPDAPSETLSGVVGESFCVVRHPFTRIISAYIWHASIEAGCHFPLSPWSQPHHVQ